MAKKKTKKQGLDNGGNVRRLRMALGMTTTGLADKVDISQAQVSRLENGKQGFRSGTLVRIAKALKVRPWVLYMTEVEQAAAEKSIGLRG